MNYVFFIDVYTCAVRSLFARAVEIETNCSVNVVYLEKPLMLNPQQHFIGFFFSYSPQSAIIDKTEWVFVSAWWLRACQLGL
jgi:hypothetical protein